MKMYLEDLKCVNENINVIEYLNFMNMVKQYMENPSFLGDFTEDDILSVLENGGKIWIYYDNDIPVCSMMLLISNEKNMEKFELNLDYKEVVDYGAMFVNPKYVGRNLQYQMLNVLDTYAKNNNYKYAVVTVHPDNSFSINNILKDNFKMHLNKDFKRGNRNIYLKIL